MGGCKRSVSSIAAMDTASASGASMSKRRKTGVGGGSCELELCSTGAQLCDTHLLEGLHDVAVSPANSVNSAGTVVSGEVFSDWLMSCSSSNVKTSPGVADRSTTPPPLDLEAKGFETVGSAKSDLKIFSSDRYLWSESSGDSEETTMILPVKAAVSKHRNIPSENMPPEEEIEEFFAMAEKYEQKRFAEKYNYDISKDMPLEGRYEWVRLN